LPWLKLMLLRLIREGIITRFFNSLNRKIVNIIELHHYIAKENMVYIAFRIETVKKKR